jgi:NCS1 family nucleobase:cation symporter-1
MKALNTTISNVIPPLINIPDLARYANRPRDTWPMVAGLLFSKPLVIFLGIITTSAGVELFGKVSGALQHVGSLLTLP